MKKLIIKIIISIVLIGIAVSSVILFNNYNKAKESKPDPITNEYEVNIVAIDRDEKVIIDDKYNDSSKTLFELLDENYEIRYDKTQFGIRLLDIESIKTDFVTYYIAIYINDEYSTKGVSSITLEDGMKIEFRETKL